jgi:hypothetical protein
MSGRGCGLWVDAVSTRVYVLLTATGVRLGSHDGIVRSRVRTARVDPVSSSRSSISAVGLSAVTSSPRVG